MKFKEIHKKREASAAGEVRLGRVALGPQVERLLRHGPKLLSNGELLALVLGTGPTAPDVVAAQLLSRWGSLVALARARPQELVRLPGLGWARGARLVAAFELGARGRRQPRRLGLQVTAPADLRPLLCEEFRGCDREHFLALYLDTRHRLAAVETISVGSLNASLVHPREVFRPAVACAAAAVIVAHNHPSGCVRPSGEDRDLTARLSRCGHLLGIELLDHIIVAGEEILSLREHCWPDPEATHQPGRARIEGCT